MCVMVRRKSKEEVVVAKEGHSYREKIKNFPKLFGLLLLRAVRIEEECEIEEGMKLLLMKEKGFNFLLYRSDDY